MLDYIRMKMPNGDYYNVKVQSSYTDNIVKDVKDIKRDTNEYLSFLHQFLML